MKNIRFRIWDKKHNRWFHGSTDPQAIATQTDALSLFGETIVMGGLLSDQNEDGVWEDDPDIEGSLDIIDWLEVCVGTGLKDKNGREIFEGDIVADADEDLMKIIWSEDYCAFIGKWLDDFAGYYDVHELGGTSEFYEIVGNIYENPELLEGKK